MSASLEMKFKMTKGSDEEFQAVLEVLRKIGGSEQESWWGLNQNGHSFTIGNSDFPAIWGDDYLETDPKPYILFAKAAPKAEWTASSDRFHDMDGTESEDKVSYAMGKLTYEYIDQFQNRMDYDELCEYVQENGFDEDEEECDDEEEGKTLTLEQVENCFEEVDEDVVALFEDRRGLKRADFCLMGDGYYLCLYKMDKMTYVIREYFNDGKEPESMEGKTFVITGKLSYFNNRDEMTEYIEGNGGKVSDSVSKKTGFLICNEADATSSKAKKAAELGTPVITEGDFIGRFGFPEEHDDEDA